MYTKPKPVQAQPAVTPKILKAPGQKDDILDIVNEVTKIESQLTQDTFDVSVSTSVASKHSSSAIKDSKTDESVASPVIVKESQRPGRSKMEELAIKSLETTKAIQQIQKSIAESQVVPVQTTTAAKIIKVSRNMQKDKNSPKY